MASPFACLPVFHCSADPADLVETLAAGRKRDDLAGDNSASATPVPPPTPSSATSNKKGGGGGKGGKSGQQPTAEAAAARGAQVSPLANWRDMEALKLLNLLYDVTPADFVTAVVCDSGMVPATSVPVILRENAEQDQRQDAI